MLRGRALEEADVEIHNAALQDFVWRYEQVERQLTTAYTRSGKFHIGEAVRTIQLREKKMTTLSYSTFSETSGVESVVEDTVMKHQIVQPAAKKIEEPSKQVQEETKAVSQTESNKEDAVKPDDSIEDGSGTSDDNEDEDSSEDDEDDEDEEEGGIEGAEDLSHIPQLKEIIQAEKGELDQSIDKTMQLQPIKTQSQKRPPSVKTQFHPKEKTVKLRLTQTEKQSGTLDEYEGDLEALNDFKKAFHIPVKELPTKPAEKPETSDLNNQLNPHVPTVLGNQPTLTGTAWFFCREYMQYLTAIVSNATRSRHKEHEVYGRLVVTDKRYEK
ncbi:unnamed protein product [Cylicocyclus nassatus]|uniref:Uncharacterized protein n=1 Tax=Cylicocyclus nassatus TaxID=53992 RepID=A0AA36GGU5_CYLNA|nr:unnamed protein product [Cylicocyclus nassatus]